MPSEYFPKIKQEYDTYEKFLSRKKQLEVSVMQLEPVSAKRNCAGKLKVHSGLPDGNCIFEGIISIVNRRKYFLKIFADYFGSGPCFRFCSHGRDHVNEEDGSGLPTRAVPTPHFHKVGNSGRMVAYQGALSNTEESERVLSDFQLGTNLFCRESKLASKTGENLVVQINARELDLSNNDPLNGANFPL